MIYKSFKMKLYDGMAEEYEKRHNELWPEMKDMIHEHGGLFMGLSSDDKMLNIKEKALVFIVSCLVFYFTSTGLYLSFTPVGEFIIKGYQARYVWPVIPLLLMLLSNKKIKIVNSYKLSFNCSLIITFLFLYSALYYQIVI